MVNALVVIGIIVTVALVIGILVFFRKYSGTINTHLKATCKQLGIALTPELCTESNIKKQQKVLYKACDDFGFDPSAAQCNQSNLSKFKDKCDKYDLTADDCNAQSVYQAERQCEIWNVSPCNAAGLNEKWEFCENIGLNKSNCLPKMVEQHKQLCLKEGLKETCTKAEIKRKRADINCKNHGLAAGCSEDDIAAKLEKDGKSTDVCVRVWGLQPGCTTGEKLGLKPGFTAEELKNAAKKICKSINTPFSCSPGDAVGILGTCKDFEIEPCLWESVKPKLNPSAKY